MSSPCTCTDAGSICRVAIQCAALLFLMLVTAAVRAAPLEKLLMPGKLTQAHAKYESECAQCHASFSRATQRRQCLDCHDKVDQDIRDGKGFHGLAPQVAGSECRQCHSEHKGRDADIVGLVPALFDHAHADFTLDGAHRKLPCKDCHVAGKPLRDAPDVCIDCHRKDDVHKGQMGKECKDCHSARTWRKSEFDHDGTDFPLQDKHRDVACAGCHPDRRYKDTPTRCSSCHGLQDRHGGLFGDSCADCHGSQAWKTARFDHDKTGFGLQGRHRSANCHVCHSEQSRGHKLATHCYDCHRGSDFHQGRFGRQCQDCHKADSWQKKTFDHDRDTSFPLLGPHRDRACTSCHSGDAVARTGGSRPAPARACVDCHRIDDVHRGQQGDRCDACHRDRSWREGVKFDHDLTRFPLVGLHAIAPCAECHLDDAFRSTPQACSACHQADDVHRGALGSGCAACHNPSGWARWSFDHDKQTDFPLEGRHRQASCGACHRQPERRTADMALGRGCNSCHASDDAHRGGFGPNCERCHQPGAFSDVRFNSQIRSTRIREAQ